MAARLRVAIPLGQGQVFNGQAKADRLNFRQSQSLWVRDRFLMNTSARNGTCSVAIPLGQGQVFNASVSVIAAESMSQSLWVRDRFLMDP